MEDVQKTKAQLIQELEILRQRVTELESDHKQASDAFAEQRNLMQTILDNVPSFIYVKDVKSQFTLSNAAHLNSMGMTSVDDVLGKTDLELFPKALAEQFYADERALFQTEQPILRKEERSLDEAGQPMWALTTKVLLRDQQEQVAGLVGITHDITDLKNAEEALHQLNAELEQRVAKRTSELAESGMRYRGLFNRVPIGLYRTTPDGRVIDVNQAFIDMLGYPDRESMLASNTTQNYVNIAEREAWKAALERDGEISNYILQLRRMDGEIIWVETNARMINEDGELYYDGAVQDITERKRMEEALRVSEEKYRLLIENAHESISIIDDEGTFLFVNNMGAKMMGGEPQDYIGKTMWDIMPKENADVIMAPMRDLFLTGESITGELPTPVFVQGELRWFLANTQPIYDETGKITSAFSVASDITELKQTQEALQDREQRLSQIIAQMPYPVEVFNPDGIATMVNQAFLDMFKAPSADLVIGKHNILEGSIAKDLGLMENIERAFNGETIFISEIAVPTNQIDPKYGAKGEGVIFQEITMFPVFRSSGEIWRIVAIWKDITERKQAEGALQVSEEKHRLLIENAHEAITIVDAKGTFLLVNNAAAGMTGGEPQDYIGKTLWDVFPKDVADARIVGIRRVLESKEELSSEFWLPLQGKVCWFLANSQPIYDSASNTMVVLTISMDITERKQAEKQLRELQLIVNQSSVVVFLWQNDEGWPVEFVSGNVAQFGYTAQDFHTRRIRYADIIHSDDLERIQREVAQYGNETYREKFEQSYRIMTADGQVRWVEDRTSIRRDKEGNITHFQGTIQDVTMRKQMEQALQYSEMRYRQMFENNHAVQMLINPDTGDVIDANPAAIEFYGYTHRQLKSMKIQEINILPDSIVHEKMQRAKLQEQTFFEFEHRLASGRICPVDVYSGPIDVDGGQYLYSIIVDATERKQAEQALRESEESYRLLIENAHEAINVIDADGNFILVNHAAAKLSDAQPQDFVGKTLWDFLPKDEADGYMMLLKEVLRTGQDFVTEIGSSVNGKFYYFLTAIQPIPDSSGEFTSVLVMSTDITEQKQTMAALQKSEARAKGLLEANPDMVFHLDKDGVYLDYQAKLEDLYDPTGQIIGKTLGDYFSDELANMILENIGIALDTGKMQVFEYPLSMPNGVHYYEARIVKCGTNEVIATVRDITERKQAESQRIELVLEQNRTKILKHFITQASHEFRTPLASINTSAHLINRMGVEDRQLRHINKIENEVNSLTTLVEDLTVLTELNDVHELDTQTIDCCEVITTVHTTRLLPVEPENIHSVLDFEVQPLLIQGNRTYLLWAIESIVDNAIRFSKESGLITIHVARNEEFGVIEITDTGSGISEGDLPYIFDRFYRNDRAGTTRGFGLGLPIAKTAIELHKGDIEVKSIVGKGSTFRILLPLDHSLNGENI